MKLGIRQAFIEMAGILIPPDAYPPPTPSPPRFSSDSFSSSSLPFTSDSSSSSELHFPSNSSLPLSEHSPRRESRDLSPSGDIPPSLTDIFSPSNINKPRPSNTYSILPSSTGNSFYNEFPSPLSFSNKNLFLCSLTLGIYSFDVSMNSKYFISFKLKISIQVSIFIDASVHLFNSTQRKSFIKTLEFSPSKTEAVFDDLSSFRSIHLIRQFSITIEMSMDQKKSPKLDDTPIITSKKSSLEEINKPDIITNSFRIKFPSQGSLCEILKLGSLILQGNSFDVFIDTKFTIKFQILKAPQIKMSVDAFVIIYLPSGSREFQENLQFSHSRRSRLFKSLCQYKKTSSTRSIFISIDHLNTELDNLTLSDSDFDIHTDFSEIYQDK